MNESDTQTGKSTDDDRSIESEHDPTHADVTEHADRLNRAADDGGGCLETAHTAAAERSRRSVLAGALAAAVSVGAVPGLASADDDGTVDDPEDITVETPPEAEQARAEADALTDGGVSAIRSEFAANGWSASGQSIAKTTADVDGETVEYYSVTMAYSVSNDDEQAVITYNTYNESASGMHAAHVDLSGDGENDHWEVTSYEYTGGSVVTTEETIENFRGCSNVNWDCVADIASANLLLAGCAACAGSLAPPACAVCIGTVINWGRAVRCSWCHG
jgi:hypothetical protein